MQSSLPLQSHSRIFRRRRWRPLCETKVRNSVLAQCRCDNPVASFPRLPVHRVPRQDCRSYYTRLPQSLFLPIPAKPVAKLVRCNETLSVFISVHQWLIRLPALGIIPTLRARRALRLNKMRPVLSGIKCKNGNCSGSQAPEFRSQHERTRENICRPGGVAKIPSTGLCCLSHDAGLPAFRDGLVPLNFAAALLIEVSKLLVAYSQSILNSDS
jgi:hypothetical protein